MIKIQKFFVFFLKTNLHAHQLTQSMSMLMIIIVTMINDGRTFFVPLRVFKECICVYVYVCLCVCVGGEEIRRER